MDISKNVYVCHIQGDPFKKPESYEGSQRQWERAHGHERQRGGENLGTLIYVFTFRDHLALFFLALFRKHLRSIALQFDCFVRHNMF